MSSYDDDGRAVGDAGLGEGGRDLLRSGEQQRVAGVGRVDQLGSPVEVDGARDVTGCMGRPTAAVGSPADVEHADLGPPDLVGQPFGRCQHLRTGESAHGAGLVRALVRWLGRHRRYHTAVVAPFMPDAEKLAAVREALPALGAGIYLNTGSVGPIPVESAAAVEEVAGWELRTGRAHPDYFEIFLERMAEARAGIAAIIGADVDSIAITHATTDGMNIATWAVDWRSGDRAVTTNHEHAGGLGPLVAIRDRFGVELAFADIGDGGDDERTVAAFDAAIRPGTKLVSLSHVLWTTGARLPVDRIAAIAHERGALVVIDGAQAVGAIPVAVEETGADFYAVAGREVAARPGGHGRAVGRPERPSSGRRPATSATSASNRSDSTAPPSSIGMPDASRHPTTTDRRSSGSREAAAGCRCTSGCRGSTRAGPRSPAPPRSGWRRSRASSSSRRASGWRPS